MHCGRMLTGSDRLPAAWWQLLADKAAGKLGMFRQSGQFCPEEGFHLFG